MLPIVPLFYTPPCLINRLGGERCSQEAMIFFLSQFQSATVARAKLAEVRCAFRHGVDVDTRLS